MRQFKAYVRDALGSQHIEKRAYASTPHEAWDKLTKWNPDMTVSHPFAVPVDEQTEEGRPD